MKKQFKSVLLVFLLALSYASINIGWADTTQATQTTPQSTLNSVNINTATAAEIAAKLTGIGSAKAQLIVDYRTKHGDFVSIEELTQVKGIGEKLLAKNKARIAL